jgi:hypothetical protein
LRTFSRFHLVLLWSPLLLGLACRQPPAEPDQARQPEVEPSPVMPLPGDGAFHPEDPRWKRIFAASSSDGLHWTARTEPLALAASSPQLVRVGDGLRVYFVDDGRSIAWLPFEGGEAHPIDIQGLDGGLQVDPCLVPLPDGGLRLYLVHHERELDPGLMSANRVLSATSPGGDRWSLEPGVRLEGPFVDPDVVALPEGGLRMFLTRSTREVASARSSDGLDFELEEGLRFEAGGVSSTLHRDDGWWMFFHESGALGRARSPDGVRFDEPERLRLAPPEGGPWMLESPSVLEHEGQLWMVYAVAPTQQGQVEEPG